MNIYLDIDGVILANDLQPSKYVYEFLEYVTSSYSTYWLTTHCKGDALYTTNHLARFLDRGTLDLTKKIKPTNWNTWKTEAIDWNEPFLWFDDYIFDTEKSHLMDHGAMKNWIEVDLSKNVNQLIDFVNDFPVLS